MALRPCKECKKEISSDAKVCPHCGKKATRSRAGTYFLAILAALLVMVVLSSLKNGNDSTGVRENASTNDKPAEPTWSYDSQPDKMRRGKTEFASLESVNHVNFDFPYDGGSVGVLTLRNSPRYGKDAILQVSKGQFMCNLEDCDVTVRVDGHAPVQLSGNEPDDGSSNTVFLPYGTILRDLKMAKILRIEASFYQEGSRVFEFHPQGLDLKKLIQTP